MPLSGKELTKLAIENDWIEVRVKEGIIILRKQVCRT